MSACWWGPRAEQRGIYSFLFDPDSKAAAAGSRLYIPSTKAVHFFVDLFYKSLSLQTQPVPKSWNDSQLINASKSCIEPSSRAGLKPLRF